MKWIFFSFLMMAAAYLEAQVKIGDNPLSISPGSILELESTSKAFTLPRMSTAQMEAISTPLAGMMLYNTDSNCIYFYKGNNHWAGLNINEPSEIKPWPYHTNNLTVDTTGNRRGIISLTGINLDASGDFSHAEGRNAVASGDFSWAIGDGDTATNYGSFSLGVGNKSAGAYAIAGGLKNIAAYQSAVALGQENKDSGWASLAVGLRNVIHNGVQYSSSVGLENLATRNLALQFTTPGSATFSAGLKNYNSGYGSIALGGNCFSTSTYSFAGNFNTIANTSAMAAFGHYNDTIPAFQGESYVPDETLFVIGNGTSNSLRRNSFTMLRNGFTSINTTSLPGPAVPRAELDVRGTGALIVPVGTTAQRPAAPVEGMIRLCTDCGTNGSSVLQGYDGTEWVNL